MHLLDIDLLDFVGGEIDNETSKAVSNHLETCLLCRIRVARLQGADAAWSSGDLDLTSDVAGVPSQVLEVLGRTEAPAIGAGQVWIAGSESRLLVWVRGVSASGAVMCHPVSLEVEAADDTTLQVDLPGVNLRGGIVVSIVASVPTEQLKIFVGYLDVAEDVETLRRATVSGLPHDLSIGEAIRSASDERIELRQLLADDLAALEDGVHNEADPEEVPPHPEHGRHVYEQLTRDLPQKRGHTCDVRPVMDSRVHALARQFGWDPAAMVTELTCSVLVLVGSSVPMNEEVSNVALRVCDFVDASAVAFVEGTTPHMTLIYRIVDLQSARETPSGVRKGPQAGFPELEVDVALFKFLEQSAFVTADIVNPADHATSVKTSEIVSRHVASAVEELRGRRAQKEKLTALRSLREQDAIALGSALADERLGVEELFDAIRSIAEEAPE